MAKANPRTLPAKDCGISKISPLLSKPIKGQDRETIASSSSFSVTKHNVPSHIASDTLSDWRRKSAMARHSRNDKSPLEHRHKRRRKSKQTVHLFREGKTLGTTRTFDMNSKGIGVECGNLDLHKGEIVEVALPENASPGDMRPHACCRVMHAGKQCGLMFLGLNKFTLIRGFGSGNNLSSFINFSQE